MKTLYIVRGLPGSGKSTHAKSLVNHIDQICENDDYYSYSTRQNVENVYLVEVVNSYGQRESNRVVSKGVSIGYESYNYDEKYRQLAGWWCWAEAFRKLRYYDVVAVANCFASKVQIEGYLAQAKKFGVKVVIVNMQNISIDESFKRNVHKCSKESIEKMYASFEEYTQDDCDAFLSGMTTEKFLRLKQTARYQN